MINEKYSCLFFQERNKGINLILIIKQIRKSISKDIFYTFNNNNENLNKSTYIPSFNFNLILPIEFQTTKITLCYRI